MNFIIEVVVTDRFYCSLQAESLPREYTQVLNHGSWIHIGRSQKSVSCYVPSKTRDICIHIHSVVNGKDDHPSTIPSYEFVVMYLVLSLWYILSTFTHTYIHIHIRIRVHVHVHITIHMHIHINIHKQHIARFLSTVHAACHVLWWLDTNKSSLYQLGAFTGTGYPYE